MTHCALALLFLLFQRPPSIDILVNGIEKSLKEMTDFSADFEQVFKDSSNQVHRSGGHLDLKRDRGEKKMRAHYQTPQEKLYISDGKTFTEYTPAVKQAVTGPAKKAESDIIPFMLLLGEKGVFDPFEERKETFASPTTGRSILKLTPRDKKLPVVELDVDPKTFLVHQLTLRHPSGELNTYTFKDPKANRGLSSSLFEFRPGPGIEVITQK